MIRKLKTLMVICFVLVNALFLAGASYASYRYFFNFTSDEISETKLSLLNESANKLSAFIQNISEAGTFIAIDGTVQEIFGEKLEDPYRALLERNDLKNLVLNISSLKEEVYTIELYTDRYQAYPYLYDPTIQPISSLQEKAWFTPFIENVDNGWVPKHTSKWLNREVISYIHRILDQRGNTAGYVKINVLADNFLDYLIDTDLYEEIKEPFVLLNTGGKVIAETHPRTEFPVLHDLIRKEKNSIYETLLPEYDNLANHHQLIRKDNEYFLLLISEPNYEQWRLLQVIPVDELYAEMKGLGFFVLIIGLVAIVLSIPIVYGIGRWITIPITQMVQGMNEVKKGRFDVKMNHHYIEEYDILAENFNRMTKDLATLLSELEKENIFRREAEVRALQSQIMPHFLYNTLDMIKWKSLDHDAETVSEMVNKLSKMLRIGLSGGLKFIRLRDELEHAKCFMDIQKQRLKQSIYYQVRVPASLKDLYIPKIIIQPFIENSIKYGYDLDKEVEIHLTVSAMIEEANILKLTVTDNGHGLPDDWNENQVNGIGIRNVKERIWMYCGDEFDVEISNLPDNGVKVDILLPILKEEPYTKNGVRR